MHHVYHPWQTVGSELVQLEAEASSLSTSRKSALELVTRLEMVMRQGAADASRRDEAERAAQLWHTATTLIHRVRRTAVPPLA